MRKKEEEGEEGEKKKKKEKEREKKKKSEDYKAGLSKKVKERLTHATRRVVKGGSN